MNKWKSDHELMKVWPTHKSPDMKARKSYERMKVWSRTHEDLIMKARIVWWTHKNLDMNARKFLWTHESLSMNSQKFGERTKVWWTQESLTSARKSDHERTNSLMNAQKSGHEFTKVWRTHESRTQESSDERMKIWAWTHENLANAQKSGERKKIWLTQEGRSINARMSGERTKVWTWTHESSYERTKVWAWTHENLANAQKSGERKKVSRAHGSLIMNARKSGERMKVWTWALSIWDGLDIPTFRLGCQPGLLFNRSLIKLQARMFADEQHKISVNGDKTYPRNTWSVRRDAETTPRQHGEMRTVTPYVFSILVFFSREFSLSCQIHILSKQICLQMSALSGPHCFKIRLYVLSRTTVQIKATNSNLPKFGKNRHWYPRLPNLTTSEKGGQIDYIFLHNYFK